MKHRPAVHRKAVVPQPSVRGLPCIPISDSAPIIAGNGAGLGPVATLDFTDVPAAAAPQGGGAAGRSYGMASGPGGGFGNNFAGGIGGGIGIGGFVPSRPPFVPGPGSIVPTPGTSPAPEPAGWAMMITGFGLLGGVLRWRRQVAA